MVGDGTKHFWVRKKKIPSFSTPVQYPPCCASLPPIPLGMHLILSLLTCSADHCGQQLAHYGASFSHLALSGVWQVWNDTHNVACRTGLGCIGNDEQLHDVIVDIPVKKSSLQLLYTVHTDLTITRSSSIHMLLDHGFG